MLLTASGVGFSPFVWDWLVHGDRSGHLQSIVVASVLFVGALQVAALAVVALLEDSSSFTPDTLEISPTAGSA